KGRTTLLITHRLSQIRWADKILVLQGGELIDSGTHDELLGRCDTYRRIFAHYETPLPAASTLPTCHPERVSRSNVILSVSEGPGNEGEGSLAGPSADPSLRSELALE